jgi:hypothetical protein
MHGDTDDTEVGDESFLTLEVPLGRLGYDAEAVVSA